MDKRTIDGITNRYVSEDNYEVKDDRVVIQDDERGAYDKAIIVSEKISERGQSCFINDDFTDRVEIKLTNQNS